MAVVLWFTFSFCDQECFLWSRMFLCVHGTEQVRAAACVYVCVCVCVCVRVCHWHAYNILAPGVAERMFFVHMERSRFGQQHASYVTFENPVQSDSTATHCNTLQHTCLVHTFENHVRSNSTATDCNTLQHTCLVCDVWESDAPWFRCNTLQHAATHCNTLQHAATYCNIHASHVTFENQVSSNSAATRCNTLQHAATYMPRTWCLRIRCTRIPLQHTCNTLQHICLVHDVWESNAL